MVLKHACMFPIFSMAYMVAPNCKMGQLCKKPFLKFIFESASYMFFLFLLALASQKIEHVVFDVISKYNLGVSPNLVSRWREVYTFWCILGP